MIKGRNIKNFVRNQNLMYAGSSLDVSDRFTGVSRFRCRIFPVLLTFSKFSSIIIGFHFLFGILW